MHLRSQFASSLQKLVPSFSQRYKFQKAGCLSLSLSAQYKSSRRKNNFKCCYKTKVGRQEMKSTFLLLCLGFRRVTGVTLEVTWVCDKRIISCNRAANISNYFGEKSYLYSSSCSYMHSNQVFQMTPAINYFTQLKWHLCSI